MVTLSGLALFDQDPIEKRNYFILQGSTLACVLLYFLAILISYLYIFGEYEGTRVASFDRYIGTALLGWGILILAYVALPLRSPERFSRRASGLSLAILVAIVLALFLKTPMQTYLIPAQGYKNGRPQIIALVNKFIAKLEPESKIYNVWQNSTGIEHYMIRYELAPRQTQIGATSLGKPYQDTDVWTVDIESADWMALLQKENFNYVLVSQPDLKFWDQYGSIFKDFDRSDEAQLFRVTAKWLIRVP
ncbi:MAG: hypothetical protein Q7U74_12865 [Saprospiraceae bacterium]|nr:hypothetical protein [Saprospiraceae bacterium]